MSKFRGPKQIRRCFRLASPLQYCITHQPIARQFQTAKLRERSYGGTDSTPSPWSTRVTTVVSCPALYSSVRFGMYLQVRSGNGLPCASQGGTRVRQTSLRGEASKWVVFPVCIGRTHNTGSINGTPRCRMEVRCSVSPFWLKSQEKTKPNPGLPAFDKNP